MATFVEMIEMAGERCDMYREMADGQAYDIDEPEDRTIAAILAVESRIEWLGLMLAPMMQPQPVVSVPEVIHP